MNVLNSILQKCDNHKKQLAVLIDPDKADANSIETICSMCNRASVDLIFVGGSLITHGDLNFTISEIKKNTSIPIVSFPGNHLQISELTDALLFISLVSSRNADMIIGQHIQAAPYIRKKNIETISTAYMLIEGGSNTTAHYLSNSNPIPREKAEIAAATAMAAEMIGYKCIYLEAGSGAKLHVPVAMIAAVKKSISLPILCGGGIRDANTAKLMADAGADVLVIGTAFEHHPALIQEIAEAIK
ncbi:MAG: geranylgeranylglyceryl/heptaprenylglyceryl phosphate synthase [Bacteroidetes bacterium]|nr:geranylgeranylglyceryl/heptaprenylglyceryl phosphate synthase [Bacteroidota bacterium]